MSDQNKKKKTACIYYLNGECKAGDDCAYVHTKEQPVCAMFQINKCNFGDRCFNKHVIVDTGCGDGYKKKYTRERKKICKICGFEFISKDANIKCQSCLDDVMV
jgi:hypothetical protein